jgi:hypothetical protein
MQGNKWNLLHIFRVQILCLNYRKATSKAFIIIRKRYSYCKQQTNLGIIGLKRYPLKILM